MNQNSSPRDAAQLKSDEERAAREHRDAITGAPGSHPVGSGIGAAAGGVTGFGVGAALGGPIGAAIGAAAGAIAGGLGGKQVAEAFDPSVEEEYWRSSYATRPYVNANEPFDLYLPAYKLGWESRLRTREEPHLEFMDVEDRLALEWNKLQAKAALSWDKAKHAVRDAWDRRAIDRAENEGMPPLRSKNNPTSTDRDTPTTRY